MNKQKQVVTFGFVQDLDEKYWNWTDDEKEKHFTDSTTILKRVCARIYNGLLSAGESGDDLKFEFSGINHDKDTKLVRDPDKMIDIIEPIRDHVHAVVTMSKKRDINVVADWIGLESQYIEAPSKGRYGKENMLAYLVHAKAPDKYQYNPNEVQTFGTWDYMQYWREKVSGWDKHKATVLTKQNNVSADWLVKQVQLGTLTKKDIMKQDDYKLVYADNMVAINNAIQFRNEDMAFKTIAALENGEFELTVFYFYGKPRHGKTYMAEQLAKSLEDAYGWRTYAASSKNSMDDYTSEEIVLLDDLRSNTMTSSTWLHLLDAMNKAKIGARYANKGKAYRTIIMCAYQNPYEFFSYVKGDGAADEALEQFIGRLLYHIKVIRLDDGERQALVEAVVQDKYPRIYDLVTHDWVTKKDNKLMSNGVPVITDELDLPLSRNARIDEVRFRETSHFGAPVFMGDTDKAIDGLVKIVKKRNDPEAEREGERPTIREMSQSGLLLDGDVFQ